MGQIAFLITADLKKRVDAAVLRQEQGFKRPNRPEGYLQSRINLAIKPNPKKENLSLIISYQNNPVLVLDYDSTLFLRDTQFLLQVIV